MMIKVSFFIHSPLSRINIIKFETEKDGSAVRVFRLKLSNSRKNLRVKIIPEESEETFLQFSFDLLLEP